MLKNQCEVEVLVNGKPLKEYRHDGKTFVEGKKGSTFSIRLRNNSGERKLFIPSIDGLSVMNGDECSFDSSGYIVRPYSAMTLDGWRISDEEIAQFFFSSPDESYRKRMEKGNNLGVIGVAVFNEKEKPIPQIIEKIVHHHDHCHCSSQYCWSCHGWHCPHRWCSNGNITFSTSTTPGTSNITMLANTASSASSSNQVNAMFTSSSVKQDLGTGWGETKRSEVVSVEFERANHPYATFEIYYNTREQLDNMGVDLRKETVYVTPQAFPGQYCKPPQK